MTSATSLTTLKQSRIMNMRNVNALAPESGGQRLSGKHDEPIAWQRPSRINPPPSHYVSSFIFFLFERSAGVRVPRPKTSSLSPAGELSRPARFPAPATADHLLCRLPMPTIANPFSTDAH